MDSSLTVKEGIKDGFPIFLGYFTTAIAFGLLTRTSGLNFVQSVLISLTNYSGSGQFLMMKGVSFSGMSFPEPILSRSPASDMSLKG